MNVNADVAMDVDVDVDADVAVGVVENVVATPATPATPAQNEPGPGGSRIRPGPGLMRVFLCFSDGRRFRCYRPSAVTPEAAGSGPQWT